MLGECNICKLSEEIIFCDQCYSQTCLTCAALSEMEVNILKKENRILEFLCISCREDKIAIEVLRSRLRLCSQKKTELRDQLKNKSIMIAKLETVRTIFGFTYKNMQESVENLQKKNIEYSERMERQNNEINQLQQSLKQALYNKDRYQDKIRDLSILLNDLKVTDIQQDQVWKNRELDMYKSAHAVVDSTKNEELRKEIQSLQQNENFKSEDVNQIINLYKREILYLQNASSEKDVLICKLRWEVETLKEDMAELQKQLLNFNNQPSSNEEKQEPLVE